MADFIPKAVLQKAKERFDKMQSDLESIRKKRLEIISNHQKAKAQTEAEEIRKKILEL